MGTSDRGGYSSHQSTPVKARYTVGDNKYTVMMDGASCGGGPAGDDERVGAPAAALSAASRILPSPRGTPEERGGRGRGWGTASGAARRQSKRGPSLTTSKSPPPRRKRDEGLPQ